MRGTSANDARIRAVIGWDVRNWARALPFWQRQIDLHRPRRALAIGERGGGLSLWLATQGIQVVCTDLGSSFERARELHERYGVSDLVTYEELDATAIARPDQSFDLVVFKSVIGALRTKERQEQAIGEMHRVLRPNGLLLFAENLVGSRLHAQMRSRFVPWEQAWRYIRLREVRELLAVFDTLELKTWGVVGLLGRTERQRDLLGRIDSLASPRVPPAWRYILFAACLKRDG
jgi:SAM-dependent methyltransferase